MHNITLQQIQYFLAVANCENFSVAAKRLFVSQPTISKWISRLEKELGTKLFVRKHSGISLTKQGKYLYSKMNPVFFNIKSTFEFIQSINDAETEVLRIASINSYGNIKALNHLVGQFKEKYPDVFVTKEIYEPLEIEQRLVSGDIDIAISASFSFESVTNISTKNIMPLDLFIALSSDHPLSKSDHLELSELNNETFLLLAPSVAGSSIERTFKMCTSHGFSPKRVQYFPNITSLILAIQDNNGVTICANVIDGEKDTGIKLFPINQQYEPPYITAVWVTNELSENAKNFIDLI